MIQTNGRPSNALPPIPASVPSALGPIPVTLVENLTHPGDGESLMGYWDPKRRAILLCAGMDHVATLQTLWHERIHAVLTDAGIKLPLRQEEAVCDALATALVAEVLSASAA